MAIGYLNVAIIGRSDGRSAVGAAAYASRTDLIDDRTGTAYRYARKSGDLVTSFVWLPKGAPERLRDRATLWNEVEKAETRKNSQTARRIIMALPHELTAKQQEQLLQDFIKENFTRKGLAVDASIHEPDPNGDDRNDHAHLLVTTRFIDKNGFGKKDRESNDRAALDAWRASWVKLANRQLERYGHAARITFEVAEGQTPQNHMGPEATALERQGIETRAGDDRLEIITDNMQPAANDNTQGRAVGKEFDYAAGKDFAREIVGPSKAAWWLRPIDPVNDPDLAEWEETNKKARIAAAQERRQQLHQTQATERAAFDRQGEAMTARHAESWAETLERHAADAVSGYQPGSIEDAGEAVTSGFSFFLGLFTSWAESITRSATGGTKAQSKRQRGPDKAKEKETQRKAEQQREAHSRELEAMMQEQTRERESYERHRAQMLFQQAGALQYFEQQVSEKSSLQSAFDRHTEGIERSRESIGTWEKQRVAREADSKDKSPERDGPELGG